MEVLLGGLSSLLYGVADFLGGAASRRAPASAVVLWSGLISFPLIVLVALVVGGDAGESDYVLGFAAGTAGSVGLVALFAGLARGPAVAVAPVAAALSAVVPVVVAVWDGERPTGSAWLGVAVAIPAIVLCSWPGRDVGRGWRRTLPLGVVAGLGFGGFTAVIRYTSESSNLLPLVASRAATMVVVGALALFGVWRLAGPRAIPGVVVAGNAVLDVSGNVSLLLAVRSGSLALAAVAASFYPAVTVLLARVVGAEHLGRPQLAGLALTVVAVSAIAVG